MTMAESRGLPSQFTPYTIDTANLQSILDYIRANRSNEAQMADGEGWINGGTNINGLVEQTYNIPGVGEVYYNTNTGTVHQFDGTRADGAANDASGYNYRELSLDANGNPVMTDKQSVGKTYWTDNVIPALTMAGIAAAVPTMMAEAGYFGGGAGLTSGSSALEGAGAAGAGEAAVSGFPGLEAGATGAFDLGGVSGGVTGAGGATGLETAMGIGKGAAGVNAFQSVMQGMKDYAPLINTGLSVAGGIMSANAAKDAAQSQLEGINSAIGEQRRQYDQTRSDLAPYRERGYQAGNQLALMMGLQPSGYTAEQMKQAKESPVWNSGYQKAPTYTPNADRAQMQQSLNSFKPNSENRLGTMLNILNQRAGAK
jgi:hypothetical protein